MLWKVVCAALLGIGVSLFSQLDQGPNTRGERVMALVFFYVGLLLYAAGIEECILTAIRGVDPSPVSVAEPVGAADQSRRDAS